MIIMCACNDFAPRYAPRYESKDGRCRRCGLVPEVLLTTDENKERILRGVSLEQWIAAPRVPPTRGDCRDGVRPCPYLRCKFQLGAPGGFGCVLDETENEPTAPLAGEKLHHSLDHIGAKLGCGKERARQIETSGLVTVARVLRKRTA